MYNRDEELRREDIREANTLRYLIKVENEKILNVSESEEGIQSLKKIHTWYKKLGTVLLDGETLSDREKENLESVKKRIEEISKPIKEEIDILLEEFDNISDRERATEILIKLEQKYKEFEYKGFPALEDKKNFDFVKKGLEKIRAKELEEKNKDDSWEEYKEEEIKNNEEMQDEEREEL